MKRLLLVLALVIAPLPPAVSPVAPVLPPKVVMPPAKHLPRHWR